MTVLELCDPEVAAVTLEASVADAIRTMLDRRVGAVAVIDSEQRVAGVFTERDVLRKLALSRQDPETTPVCEMMTTPVEMATLSITPGEALATMVDRHFRHLPVVDVADCWECFPSATCCNGALMVSPRNWIRSSSMSPTTDRADRTFSPNSSWAAGFSLRGTWRTGYTLLNRPACGRWADVAGFSLHRKGL